MKLVYKILGGVFALTIAGLTVLAFVMSYNSACGPAPGIEDSAETMRAVVYRCYGSADVLRLEEVEKPEPAENEVLVKVKAAAVNPLDWHYMRGSPYIMRLIGVGIGAPKDPRLGVDFSGTVEAVGENVELFKPGDDVFGRWVGAFAEYLTIPQERAAVLKPENVSFEQAASVPIAAITALQALRDKGGIKPGQEVLINGASGGVGTFAVQIAKHFGAEVTGVCSGRNAEMVRSIGADHVINYKEDDYTQGGKEYDLIVDMVGNHPLSKNRQVLKPDGTLVLVGGAKGDWIGPLSGPIKAMMYSPFVDQDIVNLMARIGKADLTFLGDLMREGVISPVIDRRYPLTEVPDAIRYSEQGRASGKIIIDVD